MEGKGLIENDQRKKVTRIVSHSDTLMLQKIDGDFAYNSTDLAALTYKFNDIKADKSICITEVV